MLINFLQSFIRLLKYMSLNKVKIGSDIEKAMLIVNEEQDFMLFSKDFELNMIFG